MVLTPRRWRQVRGVASAQPGLDKTISADDGGKRARSPGRARHKRGRGCSGHPAFPTPSDGREINARLGRFALRGRERVSGTGFLKIKSGICIGGSALPLPSWERVGVRGAAYRWAVTPHPDCISRCNPTSPTRGEVTPSISVPLRRTKRRSDPDLLCYYGLPSQNVRNCDRWHYIRELSVASAKR